MTGAGGITTVAPDGWLSSRTTGPGAMEAVGPAEPLQFVEYGGPRASTTWSRRTWTTGELRRPREGYDRALLQSLVFHDSPAVEWEFDVAGRAGSSMTALVLAEMVGHSSSIRATSAKSPTPS